jgi:hypothetical protein
VLAGVGWYNLADVVFWPKVNPWVPVVSPRPVTMYSYIVFGVCLGYIGRGIRLRRALYRRGMWGHRRSPPPNVLRSKMPTPGLPPTSTPRTSAPE